jgi:molybdopterin-guanine dinucleotide biosynthesis protein
MRRRVIGIIGTAKNTGKTTALVALASEAEKRGLRLGLTGIGYDGEAVDSITLLPKPRVMVSAGTMVATSEQCLHTATAQWELHERMGEVTPLGEICIVRITRPGLILLAGPNKKHPLDSLIQRLQPHVDLTLVDGALSRMVPLMVTQGLVIATGAARTTDLSLLAEETRAIAETFCLTGFPPSAFTGDLPATITVTYHDGRATSLAHSSLLDQSDADLVCKHVNQHTQDIIIPGIVSPQHLHRVIDRWFACRRQAGSFVFSNPTALLVAGEPLAVWTNLERLRQSNWQVSYKEQLPLLAITINPFYPSERGSSGEFQAASVDPDALRNEMRRRIHLPLIDVHRDGAVSLFHACMHS